jgi:uncharacterized delta-60 repeat protein
MGGRSIGVLACLMLALVATTARGDGAPDPTFDGDGVVYTPLGSEDPNVEGRAILAQPDGRIVAIGTGAGPYPSFAVARYLVTGALDPSFGGTGITQAVFGGTSKAFAGALQPDGKIVAAGIGPGFQQQGFAIARFLSDGTLDPAFGSGGKTVASFGVRLGIGTCIALQPDGKILLGGAIDAEDYSSRDFAVVRVDAQGALDPTFGDGGLAVVDFDGRNDGVERIAVDSAGRIVLVGYTATIPAGDAVMALAVLDPAGALDPAFADAGRLVFDLPFTHGTALLVQPDDKIVVGTTNFSWTIARYEPDGTPDPSFGAGGRVSTYLGYEYDDGGVNVVYMVPRAILRQADGKLVVAGGFVYAGAYGAIARYDADGHLDESFGHAGTLVVQDLPGIASYYDAALTPDGRVVTIGYVDFPRTEPRGFIVSRFAGAGLCGNVGASAGKIRVGRMDLVEGNDELTVRASGSLPAPPSPAIDPVAKGLRLVVRDGGRGTVVDAHVPPGAYDSATRTGWRRSANGLRWKFSAPQTPGRVHVRRASVRTVGGGSGFLDVQVQSSRGEFTRGLRPLPYAATIVLDGLALQCLELDLFTPDTCLLVRGGTTVSCR